MAKIVLGITGGIAAYKATAIIRQLDELGHEVQVIPTANALRFIGKTTLEALSHHAIDPDLYSDVADVKHVQLGQSADLVIVAPATAAFLARYASGQADDLLLNTLLVTRAPVVVAPAMHTEMWQHASTASNVAVLKGRGVRIIEPASGRLTGADSGPGRLPEPEEIVATALSLLNPQPLAGKRVVITAGGTREPIDTVRYIGNYSSGKQGIAFAHAAKARGADVTLLLANVPAVPGFDCVPASTTAELESALNAAAPSADVIVAAAAVADYRVADPSPTKIKKDATGATLDLHLIENPDLLAGLSAGARPDQIIIGFAAETAGDSTTLLQLAKSKRQRKGCDYIVANDVTNGAVFGADANSVVLVGEHGHLEITGSKLEVASSVLDYVLKS